MVYKRPWTSTERQDVVTIENLEVALKQNDFVRAFILLMFSWWLYSSISTGNFDLLVRDCSWELLDEMLSVPSVLSEPLASRSTEINADNYYSFAMFLNFHGPRPENTKRLKILLFT